MAVITRNNKRPHHSLIVNRTFRSPKFSAMSDSSTHSVSRVSRYPHILLQLHREVHAPCRPKKFGCFSVLRTESNRNAQNDYIDKGRFNMLHKYQKARNDALASFRFVKVDTNGHNDGVSEDSSSQEVHVIEDDDKEEGPSMVTEHRRQESDMVVTEIVHDFDVVNTGKMLDDLTLSPKHDLSIDKQTDALQRLNFEIQLEEKRNSDFDLLRPKKEPELQLEPFVPLTKEEKAEVKRAFLANRKSVLVMDEKSNIEISVEIFQCLRPREWLNDEVINLYLELLKEREIRETLKFLNCHFFNTFFFKRLISGKNGYDFNSVRRWTSQKKLRYGLHECDKIFIPIHQENHWCLAVINQKDKKFQYLDSLKGKDSQVLKVLARYFVDEVKDKTGRTINVSSWETEFVEDLPEQKNGYDCGMFMIKYIDFYSRNLGLCFSQKHMPYFRLRTAKEILRLKAD